MTCRSPITNGKGEAPSLTGGVGGGSLESETPCKEVVPKDEEDNDDGDGDTWVQATTVGVGLLEVLGKLTAIGGDVGLVVGRLAALYLLLALGILDEAVEFLLTFGGVYVDTAEAAWFTGGEERHVLLRDERLKMRDERLEIKD